MAEISVIVPVYKVEAYLGRCVDSILAQSFPDFDLVLVNDGSPDRCGQLCEEYARQDSRITVIHRENGGLSAARNTGIEWALAHSDSRYLNFVDSDDWIHPRCLELLLAAAKDMGVSVSVCGHTQALGLGQPPFDPLEPLPQPTVMDAESFLVNREWDFNYAWGKLYRKELFQTLRYPVGKIFEDTFTTYRALFAENRLAFLDAGLYYYFKNDAGITRSLWKPRELVIFDAMREQMAFYQQQGYSRAAEKEHRLYLNHYVFQISRIQANKADLRKNKPWLRRLRRELRQLLREEPGPLSARGKPYFYQAVHPHRMRLYRLKQRLLRKLRRA